MILCLLVSIALVTVAFGTSMPRSLQVHEHRDNIPSGYTLTEVASGDTKISLGLALAQRDPAGLINALYEVSTPSNARYGQFLSKDEVCV